MPSASWSAGVSCDDVGNVSTSDDVVDVVVVVWSVTDVVSMGAGLLEEAVAIMATIVGVPP